VQLARLRGAVTVALATRVCGQPPVVMALPPIVAERPSGLQAAYVRHYHAIGQGCRRGNWATRQYPGPNSRNPPGSATRYRTHHQAQKTCFRAVLARMVNTAEFCASSPKQAAEQLHGIQLRTSRRWRTCRRRYLGAQCSAPWGAVGNLHTSTGPAPLRAVWATETPVLFSGGCKLRNSAVHDSGLGVMCRPSLTPTLSDKGHVGAL
jgi:hypothetical protein